LERAIKLKKEKQGNISQAARYEQTLAELFEQELEDLPKARTTYKAAAEDFDLENTKALADRMWRKYAELSALAEDYYAAAERFVFVAKRSLESNTMRWGVKEDLLKAGICQLATGDMVGARQKIEQYQEIDNSFAQQRECALLMDLLEAIEKGDPDM
jgi:alpha-soluble NSF attachment protein